MSLDHGAASTSPPLALLIPTRSRAHYLERLLNRLAADRTVLERRIPVLVSDNRSEDRTAEMVRALAAQHPDFDLRLAVQPENRGMIGNLTWLVEHSPPTEYVWWLGDDDLPLDGTVEAMLGAIEQFRPALVHTPCRWRDADGQIAGVSPCPSEVQVMSGAELVLSEHCLHFISSTAVRRTLLAGAIAHAPTDNLWGPHIWFAIAARERSCVVLPRVGVEGGLDVTWSEVRVPLLTRDIVDSFDAGFDQVVEAADFERMLDGRFHIGQANDEYWLAAPIEDLVAALERFPGSRELRRVAALRARRQGSREAREAAARAVERCGVARQVALDMREGERAYAAAELPRALEMFEWTTVQDPVNVAAWCNLGVVRHALGREDAIVALDTALELDPNDVEALHNRAVLRALGGRLEDATRDLRRLLQIAPDIPATQLTAELVRRLRERSSSPEPVR